MTWYTASFPPDLPTSGEPKTRLHALYVAVAIIYLLVTTGIMINGLLRPSTSEFEQCKTLLHDAHQQNVGLREQLASLERDAPAHVKTMLDALDAAEARLREARTAESGLRDRVSSLEADLSSARKEATEQHANREAAEQQARELRTLMDQDRPEIIATANLRRGERYAFHEGLTLEFAGVRDNLVTFLFDGSKRIGIPLQSLSQVVPLRFHKGYGGFVGIQPLTVWDRQRMIEVNLIRFPSKWNFTPVSLDRGK